MEDDVNAKGKKKPEEFKRPAIKTFVLLLLLSCVVTIGISFLVWWVPYVGLANIQPNLPWILASVLACVVLYVIGGALTLLLTVITGKNFFFSKRMRGMVIKVLFPILVVLGRCIGIKKEDVWRSFIAVNNKLVRAEAKKVSPERLLVLLPHCLQNHNCKFRITGNIENCRRCGKCKIKDLLELSHRYGVPMAVATGGTLARKIVKETRPEVIIGVACERDLTSGIQDTYPIPAFGILNIRPFGPCYDTDIDVEMLEEAIRHFLKPESLTSDNAPAHKQVV